MSLYTFVDNTKKKINTLYTFIDGTKHYINTLYTFESGVKKYIIQPYTLTVNPTYSEAVVTFNTPGVVVGNSISVKKGTTVSYTLTAEGHTTRTLEQVVNEDITVTPQIQLALKSPIINTNAGVSYQIASWVSRGAAIAGGTYTYTRGNNTNTWVVTTNDRGEITNYSTSGSIRTTSASTNLTMTPTGGWNIKEIWD